MDKSCNFEGIWKTHDDKDFFDWYADIGNNSTFQNWH